MPPIPRLSQGDLANFWAEGPDTPMQIALLAILDRAPGGGVSFRLEDARAAVASRLPRVPALRARIRWTRWFEGPPAWEEVGLDVADHVAEAALPDGAAEPELLRWCAARAVERLPHDRPLWRIDFMTGLADGRVGLLLVMHHAVADGVASMNIVRDLLDDAPDARPAAPERAEPPPWSSARLASDHAVRLLRGAALSLLRLPATLVGLARTLLRLRTLWSEVSALAPATRLARTVGPMRRIALVRRSLAEIKAIGHAHGATVNDVALTAVAAGLRRRLAAWGDDVERLALRTSVPMAVAGRGANQGDITVLPLPLAGEDDVARLAEIAATTRARKAMRASGTAASLSLPHVPAFLGRAWVRCLRREGARRVNLFVTNVPGPREPLWFAGARVLGAVPIAPLVAGVPLGVAVISYAGTLAICLHGEGTITDLDALGDEVDLALCRLAQARASATTAS